MNHHHRHTSTTRFIVALLFLLVFWRKGYYCMNLQNDEETPLNKNNDPKIIVRRVPVPVDEHIYSLFHTLVVTSQTQYLEWLPNRDETDHNGGKYENWQEDFFRIMDTESPLDFETMNLVVFVYSQETNCGLKGTKEIINSTNHTVTIQLSYNDENEGAARVAFCAVIYQVSKTTIERVYFDQISTVDRTTRRTIVMNHQKPPPHLPSLPLAIWGGVDNEKLWNHWKFRDDRLLRIPVPLIDPAYQDFTTTSVLGDAANFDSWYSESSTTKTRQQSLQLYEILDTLRTEPPGINFENYNLILYPFVLIGVENLGTLEYTGIMESNHKTHAITVYWDQNQYQDYDEKQTHFYLLCYLAHKSIRTIYLNIEENIEDEDYVTIAIPNMPEKSPPFQKLHIENDSLNEL